MYYKLFILISQDPTIAILRGVFMGVPVLFICFIFLIAIFQYNLQKGEAHRKKSRKRFWEFEDSSWFGRKGSIEPNYFLHPNASNLPKLTFEEFDALEMSYLFKLQETCFELAKEPMVDLSYLLNSEIRHKYGANNVNTIEGYENNYNNYIRYLYQLGKFYYEQERYTDAQLYLEEGLSVHTEISDHLILLGTLYLKNQDDVGFQKLYAHAKGIKSLTKTKILHRLDQLKEAH